MRSHESQSLVSRYCGGSVPVNSLLFGWGDKLAAKMSPVATVMIVASLHGITQVPIRKRPLARLYGLFTTSVNFCRIHMTKGMPLKAVELEAVELRRVPR